jgi:hypothetical protein
MPFKKPGTFIVNPSTVNLEFVVYSSNNIHEVLNAGNHHFNPTTTAMAATKHHLRA